MANDAALAARNDKTGCCLQKPTSNPRPCWGVSCTWRRAHAALSVPALLPLSRTAPLQRSPPPPCLCLGSRLPLGVRPEEGLSPALVPPPWPVAVSAVCALEAAGQFEGRRQQNPKKTQICPQAFRGPKGQFCEDPERRLVVTPHGTCRQFVPSPPLPHHHRAPLAWWTPCSVLWRSVQSSTRHWRFSRAEHPKPHAAVGVSLVKHLPAAQAVRPGTIPNAQAQYTEFITEQSTRREHRQAAGAEGRRTQGTSMQG